MNAREDAVWVADTITELQDEITRLRIEVELWKDRCEAERRAHEETIEHYDTMMADARYAP